MKRCTIIIASHQYAGFAGFPFRKVKWSSYVEEANKSCGSDCIFIDISLGVWTYYVHIDGVQYIAALSNTADPTLSGTELLSANRVAVVEVLYILEDELGTTHLVSTGLEDSAKPLPSFNKPRMGRLASSGPRRPPRTYRGSNSVLSKTGHRFVGCPCLGRENSNGGLYTGNARYITNIRKDLRYCSRGA